MQIGRDGRELYAEGGDIEIFEQPFDAHKKEPGFVILVLVGMGDVGAMRVEHTGDAGNEAFAVRAGDQEDRGFIHLYRLSVYA